MAKREVVFDDVYGVVSTQIELSGPASPRVALYSLSQFEAGALTDCIVLTTEGLRKLRSAIDEVLGVGFRCEACGYECPCLAKVEGIE